LKVYAAGVKIAEFARRAGIAASAVRWYETEGVIPAAPREENGYREYQEADLARLRLVVSLRRLGLGPQDAGRLARLCIERGSVDLDLAPVLAGQRAAIDRQRADLDRLEAELLDLEMTIAAASRASRNECPVPSAPIRVLFVCTHNSARSQIAEALLQRYGGAEFEVDSAGTEATRVNPLAVQVLAELGIDWSQARSKVIGEFLDQQFDYVITVCDRARATCPVFPGSSNSLHWGLDDPSEVEGTQDDKLAAFRRTQVDIAARLRPFIEVALRAAGRPPRAALAG
jgi:arsenate reductase